MSVTTKPKSTTTDSGIILLGENTLDRLFNQHREVDPRVQKHTGVRVKKDGYVKPTPKLRHEPKAPLVRSDRAKISGPLPDSRSKRSPSPGVEMVNKRQTTLVQGEGEDPQSVSTVQAQLVSVTHFAGYPVVHSVEEARNLVTQGTLPPTSIVAFRDKNTGCYRVGRLNNPIFMNRLEHNESEL